VGVFVELFVVTMLSQMGHEICLLAYHHKSLFLLVRNCTSAGVGETNLEKKVNIKIKIKIKSICSMQ
jgi:hypothetical protein